MKLIDREIVKYTNGDSDIHYHFDSMENIEEFIALLNSIEKEYGEIEEITCIQQNKQFKMTFYGEYDNIEDFVNRQRPKMIEYMDIVSFSCKDKNISFTLNKNSKELTIFNREISLGPKQNNPSNIKYYKDEYDNIIKFDEDKCMIYMQDKKSGLWIKRNELLPRFYGDGDYTEIDYLEGEEKNDLHR